MSGSGAPALDVDGRGLRIAVIASCWHEPVMEGLLGGALRALAAAGVSDPVVVRVPGAFELPVAAARLAAGALGGSGGPGAGGLDIGGLATGGPGGARGGGVTGSGVDALVALGVVVRGGTPHFEYVCQAATAGLTEVALRTGVPVGFGVLTVDTEEQALDRAGLPGSREDKGAEAAQAAVATVRALAALSAPTTPAGFGAARR